MFITDYTYAELQKEKLLVRQEDPIRYNVLTMILSDAGSLAKKENREVSKQDLIQAVKTEIRDSEKAIELIEGKNGDASKQKAELFIYKSFLPAMRSEEEVRLMVDSWMVAHATAHENDLDKRNLGKLIGAFKESMSNRSDVSLDTIDMKLVSKILIQKLPS